MATGVKLRRVSEATSAIKAIAPELIELLDKNFWDIETALTSVGAVSGSPGGGSGGGIPGSTISHHNLLDLSVYADHPQYLLLNNLTSGNITTQILYTLGTNLAIPVLKFQDTLGNDVLRIMQQGTIFLYDPNNYVAPGGCPQLLNVRMLHPAWGDVIAQFATGPNSAIGDNVGLQIGRDGIYAGLNYSDNYKPILSVHRSYSYVSGATIPEHVFIQALEDKVALTLMRKSATQSTIPLLQFVKEGAGITRDLMSYVDYLGAWNGPINSMGGSILGNVLAIGTAQEHFNNTAVYGPGPTTTINGTGFFAGIWDAGQFIFGPGITPGTTIITRVSNTQLIISQPTDGGDYSGGVQIWCYKGLVWNNATQPRRLWVIRGDSEDNVITTFDINRSAGQLNCFIPTLDYANIFTKQQTINVSGNDSLKIILPGGGSAALLFDDGFGNYGGGFYGSQWITGSPDIWYQSGYGTTPKLTHQLLYLATDRLAKWPDVDGTVVISPPPLALLNTSSNVVGGILQGYTGSGDYFRVSFYFASHTAGDRSCVFTLKWTDNIGAKSQQISSFLLTSGAKSVPPSIMLYIASGNITYDLTFTGTTGTADIRVIVERMS